MNTQPGGSEVPKVSNPNVGVQIDQQANQAFSEKQKLKEQAGAAQAEQAPAVSKEELVDLSGAARSAKEVLSEYDTSFVSVQQGKDAERAKTLRQEIPEADINDALPGEDFAAHRARLEQQAASGADANLVAKNKLLTGLESRNARYADMRQTMMEMGDKLGTIETLDPKARESFLTKASSIVRMADTFLQQQIGDAAKDASFGGQAKSALLLEKRQKLQLLQQKLIAVQQKFSPPN